LFEETQLKLPPSAFSQVKVYSDPARDHRRHGAAVLSTASAGSQTPKAGDDAGDIRLVAATSVGIQELKDEMAFPDHFMMIRDALISRGLLN
jgi:ADP-ribose pyrophosphatase YjhB (NUDIX family)